MSSSSAVPTTLTTSVIKQIAEEISKNSDRSLSNDTIIKILTSIQQQLDTISATVNQTLTEATSKTASTGSATGIGSGALALLGAAITGGTIAIYKAELLLTIEKIFAWFWRWAKGKKPKPDQTELQNLSAQAAQQTGNNAANQVMMAGAQHLAGHMGMPAAANEFASIRRRANSA